MKIIKTVFSFLRGEIVLTAAWILALVTMFFVPIDRDYIGYIDLHTLGLLFALMAVMAGLQRLGVFRAMGEALLRRTRTTRQLEGALIFLPFFISMAVTNDVALITFVPFALEVLTMAGLQHRTIPVVVMQTVAANLGSMTTPIGNPQNLYLYNRYGLSMGQFFSAMLPLTAASALLLLVFVLLRKNAPVAMTKTEPNQPVRAGRLALLLVLFLLCLCVVAKAIPLWLVCLIVLVALLIADRTALLRVDYALLFTFIGFFVFVGNLGRIPVFTELFRRLLTGHEVICAVVASQVISNVPAALLLSGFTDSAEALLIGVNLGGLGTLIASMASLISYKYAAKAFPDSKGKYLLWFTAANVVFLAILLVLWGILY